MSVASKFQSDIGQKPIELGRIRHAVTIYNVELIAFVLRVNSIAEDTSDWKELTDVDTYPMPNPQAKLWSKHKTALTRGQFPSTQPALEL
jgi:hypothetical protein